MEENFVFDEKLNLYVLHNDKGSYYQNDIGQFHREDGPAIMDADGYRAWYIHGVNHREDGPAVIWKDESYTWYYKGLRHRLDGPAIHYINAMGESVNRYFYHGKEIKASSDEKFKRLINLLVFI